MTSFGEILLLGEILKSFGNFGCDCTKVPNYWSQAVVVAQLVEWSEVRGSSPVFSKLLYRKFGVCLNVLKRRK